MRSASGAVARRIRRYGHVETAVVGGGKVTQQQLLGIFQPEDVQAHRRNQGSAGVFTVFDLTHHVERHTGGDRAGHGDDVDVAHDLHGDVHNGCVAVAT